VYKFDFTILHYLAKEVKAKDNQHLQHQAFSLFHYFGNFDS